MTFVAVSHYRTRGRDATQTDVKSKTQQVPAGF